MKAAKIVEIYALFSAMFFLEIIWASDDKISEFRPSKFQEWSQGTTWLDHLRLTLKYNHSEAITNKFKTLMVLFTNLIDPSQYKPSVSEGSMRKRSLILFIWKLWKEKN